MLQLVRFLVSRAFDILGFRLQPVRRWALSIALTLAATSAASAQSPFSVKPTGETAIVHQGRQDEARDAIVWMHPTDRSKSLILMTDKSGGGPYVFTLDGALSYFVDDPLLAGGIDLRYGVSIGNASSPSVVDLVMMNDRAQTIAFYAVDAATLKLKKVGKTFPTVGFDMESSCLYHSAASGETYVFVTAALNTGLGQLAQYRIAYDFIKGSMSLELKRMASFTSGLDWCAADDEAGQVYVGEQAAGIWRIPADPDTDAENTRVLIDTAVPPTLDKNGIPKQDGKLTSDVEGIAIYHAGSGKGYVVASSQGNDTFVVYDRQFTGTNKNAKLTTFKIVDNLPIDAATHSSGIEIVNVALGTAYPNGFLLAHDRYDDQIFGVDTHENFKIVPWENIANSASNPLAIDPTSFDPRANALPVTGPPDTSGVSDGGMPLQPGTNLTSNGCVCRAASGGRPPLWGTVFALAASATFGVRATRRQRGKRP